MAIQEFHIDTFSKAELSTLRRISKKRESDKKLTAKDLAFEAWYELEAQRQYEQRENLKLEGWSLVHNQFLDDEEAIRGIEMICYSHWHRAFNADSFPIDLIEYASCWMEATAPDIFDFDDQNPLLARLRKKYPLKSRRRLKRGYTYVWEVK